MGERRISRNVCMAGILCSRDSQVQLQYLESKGMRYLAFCFISIAEANYNTNDTMPAIEHKLKPVFNIDDDNKHQVIDEAFMVPPSVIS